MAGGPEVVLEEDVYNGESGHAEKHNAVNEQVNYLTPKVEALRALANTGRLSAGALATSIAASQMANSIGLLGDSFTDNVGSIEGYRYSTGYWNWASVLLGHRLNLVYLDGVAGSGEVGGSWTTRVDALAASDARWVYVGIGTNDAKASASAAAIIAADLATIATLTAAQKRIIFPTLPPRDDLSAPQRLVWGEVNATRRQYPSLFSNVIVPDIASWLCDPASSTAATYRTAYTQDGVHPNPLGCSQMGKCIAAILAPLVPAVNLIGPPSDPSNLLTYTAKSWGGGDVGQPSHWGGSNTGLTWSQFARTDGIPGIVQRVVVPNDGACNITAAIAPGAGGYAVGDRLVSYVELIATSSIQASPAANSQWLYSTIQGYTSVYGQAGVSTDLFPLNGSIPNVPPPASGVLLCGPMEVQPTATQEVDISIQIKGGGTYDFGRVGIVKVRSDY